MRNLFLRNLWLMAASLFFYSWGEVNYCWVMFAVITINYAAAIAIEQIQPAKLRTAFLWCAGGVNLSVLAWFKYAGFFATNANGLLAGLKMPTLDVGDVHLPLGISFFVFHSLSYVIDVYRGSAKAQRNPFNMGLYISLFPQLIAGPIVRYHDISDQLTERTHSVDKAAEGVRRFITGLGKKMLIANALAVPADKIFGIPATELTTQTAWLGALCYTFQIYFDFSGYSDMAVGLALLFGFRLPENFNYPYIATSMRDFWQRWHISLSNWFRDYLYIPMGGNRLAAPRVCLNLMIVFLLCGLWHGASWQFVAWGAYHGAFLGAERAFAGRLVALMWLPFRHLYVLFAVVCSWVLFRAESFPHAMAFYKAMFGFGNAKSIYPAEYFLNNEIVFILCLAVIAALPCRKGFLKLAESARHSVAASTLHPLRTAWCLSIFGLCLLEVAAGTYNPFIYFRF